MMEVGVLLRRFISYALLATYLLAFTRWCGGWLATALRYSIPNAHTVAHVTAAIVIAFAMAPARGISNDWGTSFHRFPPAIFRQRLVNGQKYCHRLQLYETCSIVSPIPVAEAVGQITAQARPRDNAAKSLLIGSRMKPDRPNRSATSIGETIDSLKFNR